MQEKTEGRISSDIPPKTQMQSPRSFAPGKKTGRRALQQLFFHKHTLGTTFLFLSQNHPNFSPLFFQVAAK